MKLKTGFSSFINIIQENLTGQDEFLDSITVKQIVSDLIVTKTNDKYDHRTSYVNKIKHKTSSAIYPMGHSLIERCIGSTAAILTRLFQKFPDTWTNYLQQTILVLNTRIHKSIGTSPMSMHFGRLQAEISPDIIDIVEAANQDILPPAMNKLKNELRLVQEIFAEEQQAKYFVQQDKQWKKSNPSMQTEHLLRMWKKFKIGKLVFRLWSVK